MGLGAAVFLFPNMDSHYLVGCFIALIAFIAGWVAQGRRFGYVRHANRLLFLPSGIRGTLGSDGTGSSA